MSTPVPESLESEDLPLSPLERRRSIRYGLLQRCFVRPEGAPVKGGWRCIAYNVSTTGIGVTLPYPLPVGTRLRVLAWDLPKARPLEARIARVWPVGFLWFAGCDLVGGLSDRELGPWLAGPLDWLSDR